MKELSRAAVFLHILHHAAKEPVNGAWMSAELANHGYEISPGTLYPTMHRMERDGFLLSSRELSEGRLIRTYRATDAGIAALESGRRAVRELADEILEEPQ
ncbi:PadR family transcriptional regulator [Agrococcus terreus]|uniref:PadR family transcriptional regulator n=1 Tax=Agrococcus terreus TaxID=574649 RepID=UPI0038501794